MGRVSLDQLEALKEKISNLSSGEEEEMVEAQEEEGAKEQEDKEEVVMDNKMDLQEVEQGESETPDAKGTDLVTQQYLLTTIYYRYFHTAYIYNLSFYWFFHTHTYMK